MTSNADGASGQGGSGERVSEGRVRALLANVADMVTISDRDGRIIYASPATERVSGFTPEEFMARDPFAAIHPEDRPRCAETFETLVNTPGLSLDLEHRIRHKNGSWRWVEGTFTSLFEEPEVGGLLATVRDVTERRRAEESLRASEARQAFLLELGDHLRDSTDAAEIAATTAEALGRHLGVARCLYGEVNSTGEYFCVDRDWTDGSLESMAGRVRFDDFGDLLEVYRTGLTLVVEDTGEDVRTTGNEEAYAGIGTVRSAIGVPLIKGGRFTAAFGVHHTEPRRWTDAEVKLVEDVAERTWGAVERAHAEEALRESEKRLQKAIAIETVGVLFFDLDGRMPDANEAFSRMTGYSRDELLESVSWEDLTPPEFTAATARAAKELAVRGETAPYEKQLVRKDGSRLWTLCAPKRLSGSGRQSRCVEFVLDITERKRFEAERARLESREAAMRAETAERERISRELHDRVAHSMGVVYQNLQLHKALAENAPERAREKLAVAEETARNALDQTRNLAIELRRSVADETENGVATALGTLLETNSHDGVETEFTFSGDESLLPHVVGAQVYLVMQEAIRNAQKHSGCERLTASLDVRPDELVGTVTDDGDGFDPDAASDDSGKPGIGLRSMRERAEMVGGDLNLISQPGDGTTIEVRVPLES